MTAADPEQDLTEDVPWRRAWAWLVDFVLLAVLASALYVLLLLLGVVTFGLGFGLMALLPAVPLAYHALFVASSRAATPGQSLLGLAVLRDADLTRPGLVEAALFTLGLWATFAAFMPLLLIAFFTERHRALHDIAAGLVVVRTRALTRAPAFANMRPEMPIP